VRQVLDATGLPSTLNGATTIYTERVLITTRTAGTLTLLGVRNALALTGYYQQDRDLASEVASIITPDLSIDSNNRQTGIGLSFSHRLTATTSLVASGDWNRTRGLDANADEESKQQTARLELNQQLGPRTNAVLGYRYINFESNRREDSRENAAFVAVAHRF
jgi:uncharacterized protein (PEP-CTERM system associated)